MENTIVLLKNRNKEIPLDLAAVSSEFSPKLPITIILESSIANGKVIGISEAEA